MAVLSSAFFIACCEYRGSQYHQVVPNGSFKIAYFETDSIQNQFDYFKEISIELQAKDQANAKILGDMKNAFAAKYQNCKKQPIPFGGGTTQTAGTDAD